MPFETPITIREVLERIERRQYLLPGIQREFVWEPPQIVRLFDSLLRGYPIGSFLFWRVRAEATGVYQFYEFVRNYHERDGRHNPKTTIPSAAEITAILDGQQRLTSLYVGLLGSYTERRKYARRGAESSYAKRRLYLNLSKPSADTEMEFAFRFLESEEDAVRLDDDFWFRVGRILAFKQTTDVFDLLIEEKLTQDTFPKKCLVELHRAVTELPLVNYYTETHQELDRVLNIFIRINSGGTALSYSDLLLSIASAQWEERDARQEIHDLVDEINQEYGSFEFPRDFVLKSCLMLADLDLRWKVGNFNRDNMRAIEKLWPQIADSIRQAVALIASFGFTGKTLASTNAVIPIVYYLYKRGNPKNYVESAAHGADREVVHRWLNTVLLKQTFGGVPDNVLRPIREVLRESRDAFPDARIADALATTRYTLAFLPGELEGLLEEKYGSAYAFPLLAMLYPTLDFRNKFHLDHIHPKSHFTDAQIAAARDTSGGVELFPRYLRPHR